MSAEEGQRFQMCTRAASALTQNCCGKLAFANIAVILSSAILLRSVAHCVPANNSFLLTICDELLGHEFTSLVFLSSLDLLSKVILCKGFELKECTKCLTLLLHRDGNLELGVVISIECIVPVSFW